MKTLASVEMTNFRSWRYVRVDFNKGTHLIVGEIGQGKSSILLAVYWCFYGKLPQTVQADEVINEEAERDTAVTVTLIDNDNTYRITRYRKHRNWKNKVVILKNEKRYGEKDSHVSSVDNTIIKLVGLSADEFLKVVLFSQRDTHRFPSLTDLQQKQLLESLTELRVIPYANDIAKDRIKKLDTSLDFIHERLIQQEESLQSSQKIIDQYKQQSSKQRERLKVNIKHYKTKLEESQASLLACRTDLASIRGEANTLDKNIIDTSAEISVAVTEIKKLKKRLEKAKNLAPGTKCDRCGSILTRETHTEMVENSTKDLVYLTNKRRGEEEKLISFKKELKLINRKILKEELEKAEKNVVRYRLYIKQKRKELNTFPDEKSSVNEDVIIKLKRKIKQTKDYKRILKHSRRQFKLLTKVLKQIRGKMLPQILDELTNRINKFAKPFDQNIEARYSERNGRIQHMYKRGKKWVSYRSLSGGQQQIIDLASSFATWDLTDTSRASSFDCVFLDEPFDGLSEKAAQKVPKLLSMISKKKIYLISHSKVLLPYFADKITIEQRDGSSFVANS